MFRKKAQVKPAANIKSSERRKIFKAICDQFEIDEGTLPSKEGYKILPKDVRTAKIKLHSGENATLFTGDGGKPIWIRLGASQYVPTLYTLWECPYIAPILLTPRPTILALQNGADLMARGVFDPLPEKAPVNSVVAIATLDSPTVPVAVGVAVVDCSDIHEEDTGKAAITVNVVDDTLFASYHGDKKVPKSLDLSIPQESSEDAPQDESSLNNSDGPASKDQENDSSEKTQEVGKDPVEELTEEQLLKLALEQTEAEAVEKTSQDTKAQDEQKNENAQAAQAAAPEEAPEASELVENKLTTQDIDSFIYQALLQVLRKAIDEPLSFPMPASLFLSEHLLRNVRYPHQDVTLKNSSWKKAAKFFKAMDKKGLLNCRERNGEVVIQSIAGKDNPEVRDFQVYKVKKAPAGQQQQQSQQSSGAKMVATEYWKPRSAAKGLFEDLKLSTSQFYPTETLKNILSEYVNKHQLGAGQNVNVDGVLRAALSLDNKTAALPRPKMLSALQGNCSVSHTITEPGGEEPKKLAKGPIPQITIQTERRGGNKIVTKLWNLEPFHLDPVLMAEELRVACAGSTTVNPLREGSDLQEVMVQGDQKKAITSILETKGVRPAWIETIDKANKKKKK